MPRRAADIEAQIGRPFGDVLRELYVEQGYTQEQIGALFGVTVSGVCRWLKRYGIPARRAEWRFPDSVSQSKACPTESQ